MITEYNQLLQSLDVSRKTITEHARFISTLCSLSLRKNTPTKSKIAKALTVFNKSSNPEIRKHAKITLTHLRKIHTWQKKYTKNPQGLFKYVLRKEPTFPFLVQYTPLGIILNVHELDYFSCLEDSNSNAMTMFEFSVPIIVIHKGGSIQKPIRHRQFHNTLRHELFHAIFEMYYNTADKQLTAIEEAIRIGGKKLDYHTVYAGDLALMNSETSRSEFFAYSSNMQIDFWLYGLLHDSWISRLRRINAFLLDQSNMTMLQRRNIHHIYLEQYHQYLQDIENYQRLIQLLFTKQVDWNISQDTILAIIALTPFIKMQSLKLPSRNTWLRKEILGVRKNGGMPFQVKLSLHRSNHFMQSHHKPTPQVLLRFVKTLSKYDASDWIFLRQYIIKKPFVTPEALPLLKYIIEFCPDDAVASTITVIIQIIIEDYTLTSRQRTSLIQFFKRMLETLPEQRPVYISIHNIHEDLTLAA